MRQYLQQKADVGDAILLFRMGDFYETFYEDAKTISRVLGITLTARNKGSGEPIPLAGVPYHAVDGYIAKLVRAGFKVAISEQVEDPKLAKGLVRREVDRVITPGTLTDETLLDERRDNLLAAVCPAQPRDWAGGPIGLACAELASGRFFAQVLTPPALVDELARLRPAELLVPESDIDRADSFLKQLRESSEAVISSRPPHVFDPHMAERLLCDHFGVADLEGFGFDTFDVSLCAAAAVLHYLKETQRVAENRRPKTETGNEGSGEVGRTRGAALSHIHRIVPGRSERCVLIDQAALRSLEVERTMQDGSRAGSLLGSIDMTAGPMGARRLRQWLCFPLRDPEEIRARQEAIAELRAEPGRLRRVRELLREMGDIERIAARLGVGRASPRDLVALGRALARWRSVGKKKDEGGRQKDSRIRGFEDSRIQGGDEAEDSSSNPSTLQSSNPSTLQSFSLHPSSFILDPSSPLLARLVDAGTGLEELAAFLTRALKEDASPVTRDGGFVADGYNDGLDRLRGVGREGSRWLAEFQARQARRTGIGTLKVGYNSVFGYYIEITHQHRDKVPADYVRKQTLRNAERYITDELKRHEDEVLGAAEQAKQLELALFEEIRGRAAEVLPRLQETAEAVATLDALAGLAELSRQRDYCRPEIVDCGLPIADCGLETPADANNPQSAIGNLQLEIVEGRHPVLDVTLAQRFVPNDCRLTTDGDRLLVITGPNMAGKSTYIRQVALLVLLAQTGSDVPAKSMRWSPVDRIFSRVGAGDELARGRSTFMVEMVETARILNNATPQSLVILDEIGRGTSTYDGLSLAWAITEYIAQRVGCRGLFATHYHELTELADRLGGVANYNVAVREELRPDGAGRDVVFLYQIVPGATDRSYGVHVAAMAGLPASVLRRSEAVLSELERRFADRSGGATRAAKGADDSKQLLMFSGPEPMPDWWQDLTDALDAVDLDRLTPLDAMEVLRRLQGMARRGS
jgi:DNA mismatch repair protein MutS